MLLDFFCRARRGRRNLASAFVGEIVAAMEAVADHADVRRLLEANRNDQDGKFDFSGFELPHLSVYEANVDKLARFSAPIPRELTYFYTRLMTLPGRLHALDGRDGESAVERRQRRQAASDDISRTIDLGDDLLRHIKLLVSRRQPDSISRA